MSLMYPLTKFYSFNKQKIVLLLLRILESSKFSEIHLLPSNELKNSLQKGLKRGLLHGVHGLLVQQMHCMQEAITINTIRDEVRSQANKILERK